MELSYVKVLKNRNSEYGKPLVKGVKIASKPKE